MTCFVVGLEDNLVLVHIRIMEKLATLIPDFNILVDVFNDMKAQHSPAGPGEGEIRISLVLGLNGFHVISEVSAKFALLIFSRGTNDVHPLSMQNSSYQNHSDYKIKSISVQIPQLLQEVLLD